MDKDFTSEFTHFYANTFQANHKVCRRVHFFAIDIDRVACQDDPAVVARELEDLVREGRSDYLGFVVIRPIEHAPIGRTVLVPPVRNGTSGPVLTVHSEYHANVMGARLPIDAAPFIQQDSRVGACAQAALWVAGRHYHAKHREGWFSIPAITQFATTPIDETLSQSLPAGSDGLYLNHIARALNGMKCQPLIYAATNTPQDGEQPDWPDELRPEDVICRYVDSGIPVILGLYDDGAMGHAVTVVGYSVSQARSDDELPDAPSHGVFCHSLLIHDDASGPYLQMPVEGKVVQGGFSEFTVRDNVYFIIVPFPAKVYLTAEQAEQCARSQLDEFSENWDAYHHHISEQAPDSLSAAENFVSLVKGGKIITRTYLASGARYKNRLASTDVSRGVKKLIVQHSLPRIVWVVEVSSFELLNKEVQNERKVLGHVVLDATSSLFQDALVIRHFPGYLQLVDFFPKDRNKSQEVFSYLVDGDAPYIARLRR
ncbi:MAG: hypothetical protein AB1744_08195 [Candidatus Zixiibacteriota bacterium]